MILAAFSLLASTAPALSSDVEISPAVRSLSTQFAPNYGPEVERELKLLLERGDRTAAAMLGELLMMPNRAGKPDFALSCDYAEKAGRHASALHNSATCYFLGKGRVRDRKRARELYGQAAEMGYAKAACAFGNMLINGDGGPADASRGVELCRRAADTGLADAQTDYGGYLLIGQHVPKDAVRARHYLTLAADQGQGNAAFLLAQIYWRGDGTDRSIPQAAQRWIAAYERGRTDAAYWIGFAAMTVFVDGAKSKQPVPTPIIGQARKWLQIASREDPDAGRRKKAAEFLPLLAEMVPGSDGAR